jgi:hypothetical protein
LGKEIPHMQLVLSSDEAEVLEEILSSALGDLKEQIYKAEVTEYRTALKQREAIVVALLERLRAHKAGRVSS